MIIEYDRNPNLTTDQKVQSLKESVQLALNEVAVDFNGLKKRVGVIETGSSSDTPTPIVTTSYEDLTDKPSIEGVTLIGNKTFPDLNLNVLSNSDIQDIFDNLI